MARMPEAGGSRPLEQHIHTIRDRKVMLDADLAALYGVETKILNRAVSRNRTRFPDDFMFQLTGEEAEDLRFQIGTSKAGRGGRRYLPYVFTEHGVVMLSAVLNSARAVQVSIGIVQAFVRMRELIASSKDLAVRVERLERSHDRTASVIEVLVEDIDRLAGDLRQIKAVPKSPRRKIGFDL